MKSNNSVLFQFSGGGFISRPFITLETVFYILLHIKTPQGFESFARFYIGNKEELAHNLFEKLKGNGDNLDNSILQMDLMETRDHLPLNIKVLGCTLEEMAANCKVIAKEAFKIFTLEQ